MLNSRAARLLLPLVLFRVAFLNVAIAGGSDWKSITFYHTDGSEYTIGSAPERITREYGLRQPPRIIVVAAATPETDRYQRQQKILRAIDAEQHRFLLVTGYADRDNRTGYSLRQAAARRVLGDSDFRILFFDGTSSLLKASATPLSRKEIIKIPP